MHGDNFEGLSTVCLRVRARSSPGAHRGTKPCESPASAPPGSSGQRQWLGLSSEVSGAKWGKGHR